MDPLGFPDVRFKPRRYSWHCVGGPERATVTAYGPAQGLWKLLEWLRAPVEVVDWRGEAVWWGFVDEVTVRVGAIEVALALKGMSNRVAVAYSLVEPGSATVGTRATTTWVQDDDCVAEYGTKELLISLSGATAAQAEAARDASLVAYRYPIPVVKVQPGKGGLSATLRCRGWWDTLGWQYYANTGTGSVVTTTQVADVVTAEGQFLTDTEVVNASGVSSSEYRDGDVLALGVVVELLKSGTTNDRRLLAKVTRERVLAVYEEPEYDEGNVELFVEADGRPVDRWGNVVMAHTCPVGKWCGLKDVVPPTLDVSRMADPGHFFVERAEFDVGKLLWAPEGRGTLSPWEVTRLVGG